MTKSKYLLLGIFLIILMALPIVVLLTQKKQELRSHASSSTTEAPIGYFDVIDSNYVAKGWALDPDTPSQAITVHVYVDGPAGQGTFVTTATANLPRPDVNQLTGYPGDHGFAFPIPAKFRIGYRKFYIYAIDSSGSGTNPQLSASPKSIGAAPNGDAEIRGVFKNSSIIIGTTNRLAGAIGSLTWNGKEFINIYDHGRELQSASSFNNWRECFNPTEAGSADDGTGSQSTSQLQLLSASGNILKTQTQMAFWLKPGETGGCGGGLTTAQNTSVLSNHLLSKTVTIGFNGIANVIEHKITFRVPNSYSSAVFEALTGYMPPDFSKFWTYDPKTKTIAALSDGPGEKALPVILATPDGNYAMGIYSPDLPQTNFPHTGYGRWRFDTLQGPDNATVKWNCVFRESNVAARDYTYRCYSIIGTLNDVTGAIDQLYAYFKNPSPTPTSTPTPTPTLLPTATLTTTPTSNRHHHPHLHPQQLLYL